MNLKFIFSNVRHEILFGILIRNIDRSIFSSVYSLNYQNLIKINKTKIRIQILNS